MELTLRQAHKLVDKINAHIATYSLTDAVTDSVSAWSITDPAAHVQARVEEFDALFEKHVSLVRVRHHLRDLIRKANAAEIDDIVSERKYTLDVIGALRTVASAHNKNAISDMAALQAKINAVKSATSNSYMSEHITICILDAETEKQMQDEIRKYQLAVEQLEDKLATLNAGTKVTIDESVAAFLQKLTLL